MFTKRRGFSLSYAGYVAALFLIAEYEHDRCKELEQYGWLDFLDFLESEQLVRNHGE